MQTNLSVGKCCVSALYGSVFFWYGSASNYFSHRSRQSWKGKVLSSRKCNIIDIHYSIIGFEKSCNAWLEQPYPTLTDSVFQFFPQYIQYWVQAMIICAHQDVDTRSKFKWVERIGVYFRSPLVYLGVYPPTTVNLKSLCTNLIIFVYFWD